DRSTLLHRGEPGGELQRVRARRFLGRQGTYDARIRRGPVATCRDEAGTAVHTTDPSSIDLLTHRRRPVLRTRDLGELEQEVVHFPCCCLARGIAREPFVQARWHQLSHHLLPMRMLGYGQWDDLVPLRVEPEMLGKDRGGSC